MLIEKPAVSPFSVQPDSDEKVNSKAPEEKIDLGIRFHLKPKLLPFIHTSNSKSVIAKLLISNPEGKISSICGGKSFTHETFRIKQIWKVSAN